jgi:hypothetical protein
MPSRYRGDMTGGGGFFAVLATTLMSAFSMLIGLQGFLNLQYLPVQLTDFIQKTAWVLGLSVPEVSLVFLASGLVWLPIGFALGRASA